MSPKIETAYEIRFGDREDFERAWPYIVSLKSKGSPLILEKSPSKYKASQLEVGVRILSPPRDSLHSGPWPDSRRSPSTDFIRSASGELPEYARVEDGRWVSDHDALTRGWRIRVRQDIILVCDGKVIDLNRIPLPADTPIIDRRWEEVQ